MLLHLSVCLSYIVENTRPVLFSAVILITAAMFSGSTDIPSCCVAGFILYYMVFATSPIDFTFLD